MSAAGIRSLSFSGKGRTLSLLQRSRQLTRLKPTASMYTLSSPSSPIGVFAENPLLVPRRGPCAVPTLNPTPTTTALRTSALTPPLTSTRSNSSSSSTTSSKNRPNLDFTSLAKLYPRNARGGNEDLWYVLVATCLIAWRHETSVVDLWKYLSTTPQTITTTSGDPPTTTEAKVKPSDEILMKTARRLREGMLKASVLIGFPRAINGLSHLAKEIKENNSSLHLLLSAEPSLRAAASSSVKIERGRKFFNVLYDKHSDLVLANMGASSGGDLSYFAVASVYGELMAETSILDSADTGLLEFACCLCGGCVEQAKGHMYGSRNLGAKGEETRGVIKLVREMGRVTNHPEIEEYLGEMPFLEKANDWE